MLSKIAYVNNLVEKEKMEKEKMDKERSRHGKTSV